MINIQWGWQCFKVESYIIVQSGGHKIMWLHYSDVILSVMVSQITGILIVCSTDCSGADQRKHQSFASLAFLRGICWWPVDSPHKRPVKRKMFPFDDVIKKLLNLLSFPCVIFIWKHSHCGIKGHSTNCFFFLFHKFQLCANYLTSMYGKNILCGIPQICCPFIVRCVLFFILFFSCMFFVIILSYKELGHERFLWTLKIHICHDMLTTCWQDHVYFHSAVYWLLLFCWQVGPMQTVFFLGNVWPMIKYHIFNKIYKQPRALYMIYDSMCIIIFVDIHICSYHNRFEIKFNWSYLITICFCICRKSWDMVACVPQVHLTRI